MNMPHSLSAVSVCAYCACWRNREGECECVTERDRERERERKATVKTTPSSISDYLE